MHKLVVFVPVDAVEQVKSALFDAGAGKLGDYDCCAWQSLGVGQFRPLAGANPSIGQVGVVEEVGEYRVETLVPDEALDAVLRALKAAHPYETPAFDLWRLSERTLDFDDR
ncbi:MAG: YqfO family protein [Pseudomonadota bacterium]|nr:YqfO family protein [Pseudomonadota bacterium]